MSGPLIHPYLFFNGRCEEAIEFYRTAIGAKVEMMMRYEESPEPLPPERVPPNFGHKIMHATVSIGGALFMASDGCDDDEAPGFRGFSLSLAFPTEAEVQRAYAALAEGGQAAMPPAKTFWSPCFGMLTDRFGLGWMVSVTG